MNPKLKQTAEALVTHCQNGTERQGLTELYAPDARSIEAADMSGQGAEVQGTEAISGKHDWWESNFEVHSGSAEGPMYHGDDRFSVIFEMDATDKNSGKREQMKEIGVYTINEAGKISKEEFFYNING